MNYTFQTYPLTARLGSTDLVASLIGQGKCLDSAGEYYSSILVSSPVHVSVSGCGEICTEDLQSTLAEAGLVGFAHAPASEFWYCICYYDKDNPLPSHSGAFLSQDVGAGQVASSDGRADHFCYRIELEVQKHINDCHFAFWSLISFDQGTAIHKPVRRSNTVSHSNAIQQPIKMADCVCLPYSYPGPFRVADIVSQPNHWVSDQPYSWASTKSPLQGQPLQV